MRKKKVDHQPTYDTPSTIIGEDTELESSLLKSKSSIQIQGTYSGDIEVESSVVISETGKVKGNISASFVLVAGKVSGNIQVNQQVHITNTGHITGDIICQSIIVDEGGCIDGNFKMKSTQKVLKNQKNT